MILVSVGMLIVIGILYINFMIAVEKAAKWQEKELGEDNGEPRKKPTD